MSANYSVTDRHITKLIHSFFDFLLVVAGVASSFAILDAVAPAPVRGRVATFVFGYGQANLADLERSVFAAIFSAFVKDNRLIWPRIFGYSIAISFFFPTAILFTYWSFDIPHPWGYLMPWISTTPGFLMWSPGLFLFDLYSFNVTKSLLWNKPLSFVSFIGRTTLDVLLTFLAVTLLVVIPLMLGISNPIHQQIFFCLLVSMLLVNGTQILIIILGTMSRLGLVALRLNQPIGAYTNLSNHPFLFVGLLFGFIVATVSRLS